jgi:hypothetical protein
MAAATVNFGQALLVALGGELAQRPVVGGGRGHFQTGDGVATLVRLRLIIILV